MSGFLGCRNLVRPRTVRFNAFTLCFTASACVFDNPVITGNKSLVDTSRPCKYVN